jgi:hypothetical protein
MAVTHSGLWHELVAVAMTRRTTGGLWLCFFVSGSAPRATMRPRRLHLAALSCLLAALSCLNLNGGFSHLPARLLQLIQAPIIAAEGDLRRAARRVGWEASPLATWMATATLILIQLAWLWFPPMQSTGMLGLMLQQGEAAFAALTQITGGLMAA